MAALFFMVTLALAGSAAAAHPGVKATRQTSEATNVTAASNITLSPIILASTNIPTADTLAPQTNVTLPYGLNGTDFVNLTFTTSSSAVVLESVESLASVDCSSDSVSLTFDNVDDLTSAYTEWSAYDQLLFVTNHMGDCDTELERGFFLAGEFASNETTFTLVATAEKKNVSDIASFMHASFTGLPSTSTSLTPTEVKRDIVIDTADATIAAQWDLPSVTLYEYAPYVTATAESGSLAVAVTIGGYLDFDIWGLNLEALYVDVETTASADLVLALDVNAAYDDTFSYGAGVSYYFVNIAGIITFGPELSFSVGADVSADAAVGVVLDLGADISNATIHLDLVGDSTAATGWEPTYHANLTLSEAGTVGVTPFVAVTVELGLEILGGLLDLGAGLTPEVSFPTTVALDADQEIDAGSAVTNVTVTQKGSGTCADGVEVVSAFTFTLDAFVTQFWSANLYNTTVSIADECYSWA